MGSKSKPKSALRPIGVSARTYHRLDRRRAPGQTFGGVIEELLNKTEARP